MSSTNLLSCDKIEHERIQVREKACHLIWRAFREQHWRNIRQSDAWHDGADHCALIRRIRYSSIYQEPIALPVFSDTIFHFLPENPIPRRHGELHIRLLSNC